MKSLTLYTHGQVRSQKNQGFLVDFGRILCIIRLLYQERSLLIWGFEPGSPNTPIGPTYYCLSD